MTRTDRRNACHCVVMMIGVSVGMGLAAGRAAAQEKRWLAPRNVMNVLQNYGNWAADTGDKQYLLWKNGGSDLKNALKSSGSTAVEFGMGSKKSGTQVPDWDRNECVAFVRGVTGAPGSGTWKRGDPVIFPSGVRNNVTPGTAIATFVKSGNDWVYSGHCCIFVGFRTVDNGISIWDQNWGAKCVKWHPLNGSGTLDNPKNYFVIMAK